VEIKTLEILAIDDDELRWLVQSQSRDDLKEKGRIFEGFANTQKRLSKTQKKSR
jgi:hypothetical protein